MNKAVIVVLASLLSLSAFAQQTKIDGVAAVVGDNIVLYSEVKAAKQQIEEQNEDNKNITECGILEKIMNDKLLAHHAVVDSLTVDDARINSEVARKVNYFQNQLGSKEKILGFFGFENMVDLKKELFNVEKESALVKRMQGSINEKTDVTPEEVKSYFNSLVKEDALPEFGTEIEIAQIVIDAQNDSKVEDKLINELNNIKADIENGASFRMKAILYSKDPAASKSGKGSGGLYEGITMETPFVKEFKEAAFSLEKGEISEPFKSQFGYHIVTVDNIKGNARDVRHILLQSEISDEQLQKAKDSLIQLKNDILTNKISFEEAVEKHSSDTETNKNKGVLINPVSNDTKFDLTRMDPALYARISELKIGEFSSVFYDETREGRKMYKVIYLKNKIEAHTANFEKDYVKIKNYALRKKQEENVKSWTKKHVNDTYIKIHDQYKKCTFDYNWEKK